MLNIFKRTFGLMPVSEHLSIVEELTADRDALHKSYGVKHDAFLEARQELSFQKGQVATLSRRKDEETVRADLAEQRVRELLDAIDALQPHAEKYRAKLLRDREHAANRRAQIAA